MKNFLFIDTETTGFKKGGSLIQDGQARVCQIAMMLTDKSGKSLCSFSSLIKPDDWQIHPGAQAVHGKTNDMCEVYGVNFVFAYNIFAQLAKKADLIVAHNVNFDRGMMEIENAYCAQREGRTAEMILKPWHCTMITNTHIKGGKWPKLSEALKHYCNREATDAHDAMGDCIDCRDIFFATYNEMFDVASA